MDLNNFFTVETSELSNSDRKILNYMNQNAHHLELLTINKLAENANTSIASVQRFCQKLGYSGFKEFKFELLTYLKEKAIDEKDGNRNQTLLTYQNILQKMWTQNRDDAEQLADDLMSSETNFIIGLYYSEIPARLMTLGLRDLGKKTFSAGGLSSAEHVFNLAEKNSTAVFFSVSGMSKRFGQFLAEPISKLDHSYLITINQDTPLKKYFKKVIVLPGKKIAQELPFDPQSLPVIFTENVIALAAKRTDKPNIYY